MLLLGALQAAEWKSGRFRASDGAGLHYFEAGSGPAILFVPGWTMPAEIWQPQIDHFSRRWRVVAVDPRSQGDSDKVSEGHYPERRGRDYRELIDHLKLGPAVVAGWSMAVAELLAMVEHTGTAGIRALVLADGRIGADPDPRMTAAFTGLLRSMQRDRLRMTTSFVRSMYNTPQKEEYIQRVVRAALKTPTHAAVALGAEMLMGADYRPTLARLDRPVLYVFQPSLKDQADMLKARLPSARVEVFENAGHALFIDQAARFNKLVEEFAASIR